MNPLADVNRMESPPEPVSGSGGPQHASVGGSDFDALTADWRNRQAEEAPATEWK
jgi:hypothetical protein